MAPMVPTMKYWKSLLDATLLFETYFPKSGMLPALVSLPLKGLLYDVQVVPSPPAGRTAVELRARTAAQEGVLVAVRRHAREAAVRGAIVEC